MSAVILRGPLALLMVAAGLACAPIEGPVTVFALVSDPSAEGGVRLDDVVLRTVSDLRTGEGTDFNVVGGLQMVNASVIAAGEAADDDEELRELSRTEPGHPIAPRMGFDGDRYIAEDFQTLTYFSAFAGLERAWSFAEEIGDDSAATSEPALVGLDATVVASDLLPLQVLTSDNAAYAAPLDAWLLLRVAVQGGVPFAMSEAILAHEFSHRLFYKNVYADPDAFSFFKKRFDQMDEAEQRSTTLLQGVDEGLADLFALASTGDVGAVPRAFALAGFPVFVSEAARRDVEGSFADAATYDGLDNLTIDAELLEGCGANSEGSLYGQSGFNFYCLGTVLARALWDASERDVVILRTEVMPAVRRALPRLGASIGASSAFDVDQLLEPIAAELPPGARRDAACARFEERFESLVDAGRVPTCP